MAAGTVVSSRLVLLAYFLCTQLIKVIAKMIKFKLFLWAFGRILKKAAKSNAGFKEYIDSKDLTFQIQTKSGSGRHFIVKNNQVSSKAGLAKKEPTFTLEFVNAAAALSVFTSRDKSAFMAAIQNKELVIAGDFKEVMWFQGLTKHLRKSKK